jgi:hypothetical protein
MMGLNKAAVVLGLFAVVCCVAAPAFASLLDTGSPYSDEAGVWKGNTEFDSGGHLRGSVDWVVYGPGQFPFSGYEPTSADSFTYVFQVHNTGPAPITYFTVGLLNYADGTGSFSDSAHGVSGVANTATSLSVEDGYVDWTFAGGIAQGSSSCGLVFSSPTTPMDFLGVTIDHGEYAFTEPLPSPSGNSIPEPGTFVLLASGLGLALVRRFQRQ